MQHQAFELGPFDASQGNKQSVKLQGEGPMRFFDFFKDRAARSELKKLETDRTQWLEGMANKFSRIGVAQIDINDLMLDEFHPKGVFEEVFVAAKALISHRCTPERLERFAAAYQRLPNIPNQKEIEQSATDQERALAEKNMAYWTRAIQCIAESKDWEIGLDWARRGFREAFSAVLKKLYGSSGEDGSLTLRQWVNTIGWFPSESNNHEELSRWREEELAYLLDSALRGKILGHDSKEEMTYLADKIFEKLKEERPGSGFELVLKNLIEIGGVDAEDEVDPLIVWLNKNNNNPKDVDLGTEAMKLAARRGDHRILRKILTEVRADRVWPADETALFVACQTESVSPYDQWMCISLLLHATDGTHWNKCDGAGKTALSYAFDGRHGRYLAESFREFEAEIIRCAANSGSPKSASSKKKRPPRSL